MNEIILGAGETLMRDITVWADEDQTERYDLTGASVDFEVYDSPSGAKVFDGDASITNAGQGEILIGLPATATVGRGLSVLWFVVTLRESGGVATNVDSGRLVIQPRTSATS